METNHELRIAGHPAAEWRILLIEDAPTLQIATRSLLEGEGFQVDVAGNGLDGLALASQWQPDLVLLDLGLPDIDGTAVCERIRATSETFIIMLTGRSDDESRLGGLEIGADAYLTKPFDKRELLLTIEILLRRASPQGGLPDLVELGPLSINRPARTVAVNGTDIHLTKIEFKLLERLVASHDQAVTRAELMTSLWGPDWVGDDHVISVHMANLRKKIDHDGTGLVETIRGIGYRLRLK